jgi:hypothetical protein
MEETPQMTNKVKTLNEQSLDYYSQESLYAIRCGFPSVAEIHAKLAAFYAFMLAPELREYVG